MRLSRFIAGSQRFRDFAVCVVLAQCVNGPYRRRQPADKCKLEDEARDACNWPANREKR